MSTPAVSVIIPCYNAEKTLDECIGSLLNQTMQNIEIICVDDGSTDNTLKKLQNYARTDMRVRIFSQQNQYAGAARNLGLAQAKGEYILFLDADDFFAESLAQETYAAAVSNMADVVIFNARNYDERTGEFTKGWSMKAELIPEKQPFSPADCPDHLYQITSPVPWTKLFRREFLLETKLQFQTLRHTNDFFFVFSAMAMAKRIVAMDKVLVTYRVGQKTNLQSTKSQNPLCFYTAYKALHDHLEKNGILRIIYRSYANQVLGGCLYNLRTLNAPEAQNVVFEKLRDEIFEALEIPDQDASFFLTEGSFHEMHLVKYGTLEQYLAFHSSNEIRRLWNSLERGLTKIRACGSKTKAYKLALTSFAENAVKELTRFDTGDRQYMELAYQIVHGAFNRQELTDVTFHRFESLLLYQKFSMIRNNEYTALKTMLARRLIVSMTSYPARIGALAPVLDSLYNQDRKADDILLWLAKEEFPGMEQDLPEYLVQLAEQKKLTIRWCDNLKPHKKYFYALQEYTEDLIVTVDDDLLYSPKLLSSLYRSYLQYPQAVSAARVHLMLLSEENKILPYNAWIRETDCCLHTPSMQLFATGGAGTLYPPKLFRKEFFDRDAISANCPIADDLWLKSMELISGVPVVAARRREPLQYLPDSQDDALKQVNDVQQYNDVQLSNIVRWTDSVFGKDSLVNMLTGTDIGISLMGMETVTSHLDQERRYLRQRMNDAQQKAEETGSILQKTRQTLSQTETKLKESENKRKERETELKKIESRLRETEKKLRETEGKRKTAEAKLQKTQSDLRRSEESKPLHRQMKDLGIMLKGLRKKGHSTVSVGFKLLIYAIAWIPELILVFFMYFLRNGIVQTAKRVLQKLFRR